MPGFPTLIDQRHGVITMGRLVLTLSAALVAVSALAAQEAGNETSAAGAKVHIIKVGGEGFWDYLTVDPAGRRLYVSRGNRVDVIDLDAERVVGEVADTPGVHGVAVVSDLGRGFTSNGRDSSVTVFDLKTLKATGNFKVGGGPDAIHYDRSSKRVFTFNHGSKDATVIDPAEAKVVGTVALDGVPEAAVSDGKGHVFVNLMDKAEVVEFDARDFQVLHRWSLAPGQRPTGLALDREHRRLFSVCSANQKMMILDADSGKVVAELPIGQGSDGCGFDPGTRRAYSSNGRDGTLTVVREEGPDNFKVVATMPTQTGARTMALDPSTHKVYLSAASFGPAPAEAKGEPQKKFRRPNVVPGSFVVVVVEWPAGPKAP
jgi:DNA-binding beta-propeller fold protein YncE